MSNSNTADDLQRFLTDVDRKFYAEFDPFYFWTLAECLNKATPSSLRIQDIDSGEVLGEHSVLDGLKKSRERYEEYAIHTIRALRYFSSETLVLFVLCGSDFGPFARIASTMRERALAQVYRALKDEKVPEGFEVAIGGQPLAFNEWLSYQLFADPRQLEAVTQGEIKQLVVEEADLLSERGAINAFKHGKPTYFGPGVALKVKDETGEFSPLNEVVSGLNWVDWYESKERDFSVAFGTEELNSEQDMKRLMAVSLLLHSISLVRGAVSRGETQVDVHLPNNFETGLSVKRQKFKFSFKQKGVPVK